MRTRALRLAVRDASGFQADSMTRSTSASVTGRQEHRLTVVRGEVAVHQQMKSVNLRECENRAIQVATGNVKQEAFELHFLNDLRCDAQDKEHEP